MLLSLPKHNLEEYLNRDKKNYPLKIEQRAPHQIESSEVEFSLRLCHNQNRILLQLHWEFVPI